MKLLLLLINLFNLTPLSPLDGGRITGIISPKAWLAGLPILVALFLWRPSPMLLLVGALALPHVASVVRGEDPRLASGYYDVPTGARIQYACWYFGLAALLGTMTFELYGTIGAPRA